MNSTGTPGHVSAKPSLSRVSSKPSKNEISNRLEVAKRGAISILQDTSSWPRDSVVLVKELFERISNAPGLQEERFDSTSITSELRETMERFVLVMEDVCARLDKVHRKYGTNKELSDFIRHPFASLSKDGCGTALLGCRNDIDKALASLGDDFSDDPTSQRGGSNSLAVEHSLESDLNEDPAAPNRSSMHPPHGAESTLAPHNPGVDSNLASSPQAAIPIQQPAASTQSASLSAHNQPEQAAARRRERLGMARTTFETIEAISGTIPVVGSYVGAGAKVGLAVVQMIQAMDSNSEMVADLETRAERVSNLLGNFKNRSLENRREELLTHLSELQSELQMVRGKVQELTSQGTLQNLFRSGGQAEALKGYQDTIRIALEELQLLLSLNTTNLLNELYDENIREKQRLLLDRLGDASYGARGNAIDEVVCLPGTRVEVLERIDDWIRDPSPSERVLWIRGMAGRGKSTVASTVVNNWRYRAANAIFHFRRGQNSLDNRLVCSLARQLGSSVVPEVRQAILQSIRENEDIGQERLQEQFKALFVTPGQRIQSISQPILIVVDALDECEDTKYAVDFVNLIHHHVSSLSAHFKFLLTTRPEAPILRALEPRRWRMEDLDVVAAIDEDIAELLQRRLTVTRERYGLGADWPPQAAIPSLVKMSQGLFQWAQTAVEYISEGSPEFRLEELLESPSLFDGLDSLYAQILSKAYGKARKRLGRGEILLDFLGTLAAAPYPISLEIFTYLISDHHMFHNKTPDQIIQLLRLEIASDIRSLVYIPESPSEPMRLVHTSVRDLLVDRERCAGEPYFVDLGRNHRNLTIQSFRLMKRDLRENICKLFDLSKSNLEVQDIVDREVSNGLRHCCRSWSAYLTGGKWLLETVDSSLEDALDSLKQLSETKLLQWLEVMSLIGASLDALEMVKQICAWLQTIPSVMPDSELMAIWHDTHRFIASFWEPISFGALHIYASALPFCPMATKLSERYNYQATSRILHGRRDVPGSSCLWTRSVRSETKSIVIIQNGRAIAVGSKDGKIRIWNLETGTQIGDPLTPGSGRGSVKALALSPDGSTLASSLDSTICLWNAWTGDPLCPPLEGHTSPIHDLAFSPDGKVLASASYHRTIRLWDCKARSFLNESITYHDGFLLSIIFGIAALNASVLASPLENDRLIQLWDIDTGTPLGEPLKGHSKSVQSLAFSPDGSVLASGSYDQSIILWNSKSGTPIQNPLIGHNGNVSSLAFSPGGDILASGSSDLTIQLWDMNTRKPCGQFQTAHTREIDHLAFSPDSKTLVSASTDMTIQLWDVQSVSEVYGLSACRSDDNANRVLEMAFSPNGKILVSSGSDRIVKVWDSKTATLLNECLPFHSASVGSLAFSPDGTMLASADGDGSIYIWDTRTWTPLDGPLEGPTRGCGVVTFSPDGGILASCGDNGAIRLWDATSRQLLTGPQLCHDSHVTSLAFAPNSRFLASGHHDEIVRIWDISTGVCRRLVGDVDQGLPISLEFLPDGSLITIFENKVARYEAFRPQSSDTDTYHGYRAFKKFENPFTSLFRAGP